jgi:integrase
VSLEAGIDSEVLKDGRLVIHRAHAKAAPGRSFVIFREQMWQLLAMPKSTHDQLCIELPCLMGFRNKEVTTWRAEHIDFENGDTLVLDAKKHKFFRVPLHVQVASHAEKLLAGRTEGLVIRNTSRAWKAMVKQPISTVSVWCIWKKYTKYLPNGSEMNPLMGRRLFAALWYHLYHLNLVTLSKIMRHGDPIETLGYVEQLIFYEDMRDDYKKFQFASMQPQVRVEDQGMQLAAASVLSDP